MEIPKIKKKIANFLTKEEGKISKDKLVKTGILIAALSLGIQDGGAADGTEHSNGFTVTSGGDEASATHSHHASHTSY